MIIHAADCGFDRPYLLTAPYSVATELNIIIGKGSQSHKA